MAKKSWVLIVAGALAVGFLGCQSEVTEPTPLKTGYFEADPNAIEGYVKDQFGGGISGADVEWYRNSEFGPELIGFYGDTGQDGWYEIPWETAWTDYQGDYLFGIAKHPEYEDAYCDPIESFDPDEIPYVRDFTMYSN